MHDLPQQDYCNPQAGAPPGLVRFSAATSLAIHTMALLATHRDKRFTNQNIAARLRASGHHLAKVMQRLGKAGLVVSQRGPAGGFTLGAQAEDVYLVQIYEAIEGPVPRGGCLLSQPVCDESGCLLGDLVRKVHEQIHCYLAGTTLAEFAQSLAGASAAG